MGFIELFKLFENKNLALYFNLEILLNDHFYSFQESGISVSIILLNYWPTPYT